MRKLKDLRRWFRSLAPLAGLVAASLLLVPIASAAPLNGVGYRVPGNAKACFENFGVKAGCSTQSIDVTAHPWGPNGGTGRGGEATKAAVAARYCPGQPELCQNGFQGNVNENFQITTLTLERMFAAGLLGDPAKWNGRASTEEAYDFAALHGRSDSLYKRYYWDAGGLGGKPAPGSPPVEPCAAQSCPELVCPTILCPQLRPLPGHVLTTLEQARAWPELGAGKRAALAKAYRAVLGVGSCSDRN